MYNRFIVALAWIGALLFVAAGLMLSWEVVARYFFVRPTIWAAELSQLCLIWGSLIGMPWALATRRHIAVDAITRLCSPTMQRVLEILAMAVVGIFSVVVAWKGFGIFFESLERGRTTGSMLDLPTWISELPVFVGFALLAIQSLIEIIRVVMGREIPQGAHE
ncbi:TRAP transporter small permease [Thalassospira marina]|uniref:TRAP transporter small permease protein n=1 Tax=Thalassospira marina TaxID=2048283 RepID=A0A2N3KTH6_9PROT|nr:TRAP transporter small permease [Thalassospira marina]PKR53841.1 C4-dicarboxylate ABC transporter substrate-binding protein [Thalassospira marina]